MNLLIESSMPTSFLEATSSSNNIVIRLENVSVRYRVPKEHIGTFKEYVIRSLQRKVKYTNFYALKNINLEIQKGEFFGIIGKNGAGKSTLLKVVSRVLSPTQGSMWTIGRVHPLLELGAGFHPELTGIENVFLNGTLLGYSRGEIESKMDFILDFAELGKFISAPLRTYSSGMVARLGFAVATAWEPEILILDEVLSVGDEKFQQKCMSRMKMFQDVGTTILFVSHNINTIREMCKRAVLLQDGSIRALGTIESVTELYRGTS